MVDAALGAPDAATTWFCPVSIGYERFVEETAFVRELTGADKVQERRSGALVRSVDVVVGRYGRLSVQFGQPMTLADVLRDVDPHARAEDLATLSPARRRGLITRLAYRTMNEINAAAAVTPGSLVATALLAHGRRGLPEADLFEACERLARTLRRSGARLSPSLAQGEAALREAIEMFVRAQHVEAHPVDGDVIYVVPADARLSLDLAKNVIIHFFASRALIATALLAPPGAPLGADVVRERVLAQSRLFKYEFTFRAARFEAIFDEETATMVADGEIASEGPGAYVPASADGRAQIELYARLIENFLQGYRIAARGLAALLKGPMAPKDVAKRAIPLGERMFLAGEIGMREAVNRPLVENAYASFAEQGYLVKRDGKIALTESYASAGAVATIEARIAAMGASRA